MTIENEGCETDPAPFCAMNIRHYIDTEYFKFHNPDIFQDANSGHRFEVKPRCRIS